MLQHLWKSTLLSGILAVILGILVLAWPGMTIIVAAIFFGAYLLITGIAQVIFAFSSARLGGRADSAVHQRRRVADPGRAGLPSLR